MRLDELMAEHGPLTRYTESREFFAGELERLTTNGRTAL
jgi:hypothetical protein